MCSLQKSPQFTPDLGYYFDDQESLPPMSICGPTDYASSLSTLKSPLIPEPTCTYFNQSSYIPPALDIPPLSTGHWRENENTKIPSCGDSKDSNSAKQMLDFHSSGVWSLNLSSETVYSTIRFLNRLDVNIAGSARGVSDGTSSSEEALRNIDYLSDEWSDELDILASWRSVVAQRHAHNDGVRLENASWRLWAKVKYKFRTVPSETLNWCKDSDVTWLFGPLQTHRNRFISKTCPTSRHSSSGKVSKNKPILRKRTVSEVTLRGLPMQHFLSRPAGHPITGAQENWSSPHFLREAASDDKIRRRDSGCIITDGSDNNLRSSGYVPFPKIRNVHFNHEVVQFIAIDSEEDDDAQWSPFPFDPDSESDDDVLVIKSALSKGNRITFRKSVSRKKETIASLPSTTLKDPPRFAIKARKHKRHGCWHVAATSSGWVPSVSESMANNLLKGSSDHGLDLNGRPGHMFSIRHEDDRSPAYNIPTPQLSHDDILMQQGEEDLSHAYNNLFGKIMCPIINLGVFVRFIWNTVHFWWNRSLCRQNRRA